MSTLPALECSIHRKDKFVFGADSVPTHALSDSTIRSTVIAFHEGNSN